MATENEKICVRNIRELTEDLANVYNKVRNKELTSRDANDAANVAGKIMNSVKVELSYRQWLKERVRIPFIDSDISIDNK